MLGARDIGWSLAICVVLTLFFECRPAWDARRFVEQESQSGFLEAYSGHRYVNGEIITAGGSAAHVDPMASTVVSRHLEITALRASWNGQKVELIARHSIQLAEGDPAGGDASQDVHVQLEKIGSHWVYSLFEARGQAAIEDPNASNPWGRALRATATPPTARPRG